MTAYDNNDSPCARESNVVRYGTYCELNRTSLAHDLKAFVMCRAFNERQSRRDALYGYHTKSYMRYMADLGSTAEMSVRRQPRRLAAFAFAMCTTSDVPQQSSQPPQLTTCQVTGGSHTVSTRQRLQIIWRP